jgi:hypothetical protein
MTVQKAKACNIMHICNKCGSSMIERMIAFKNSEKVKFVKILQCKVCRHWILIN